MSLVLAFLGFLAALVIGELLYRWRDEPARFWGDLTQGLYALISILVVGLLLVSSDGAVFWVLLVFLVFYVWLFRVRMDDTRRDWRAMVGDAD